MSSKRDYVAAAAEIRAHPNAEARWLAAGLLANVFAKDNPRFDREKFLKACEP
jgi:hypothetical protein